MKRFIQQLIVIVTFCSASASLADYEVERVVKKLKVPWAFTWLPDGDMLVTERRGKLLRISGGEVVATIGGLPDVRAKGQGGLLDVVLHPDFPNNQLVYLSYSYDANGRSNTAIARGRLEQDSLINFEVLYRGEPGTKGGNHFGSRMAFDKNGYLYFSIGDRGKRDVNPQSLELDGGKVYRIHDDGVIPVDNPYTGGKLPAMYSLGHRNIQGLIVHPETNRVWTNEHGPRGGDEVNLIKAGENYGWPKLSYGINYSGTKFAEGTERVGFESPKWYWDPSIAPSGMVVVTSDKYPELQGHLLIGSLRFGQVVLAEIEGQRISNATPVVSEMGRVRDVRQGPDGFIYFSTDSDGIYRILPGRKSWLQSVFN